MHSPTQFSSYLFHFHSIASTTSLPLRTPRYLVTNTAETVRLRQFLSELSRSLLGVPFPRSRDVEIKETFLHDDTRDDEKITFSIIEN